MGGLGGGYGVVMTDTVSAPALPESPSLDGLEDRWATRWQEEGTYAFDRS